MPTITAHVHRTPDHDVHLVVARDGRPDPDRSTPLGPDPSIWDRPDLARDDMLSEADHVLRAWALDRREGWRETPDGFVAQVEAADEPAIFWTPRPGEEYVTEYGAEAFAEAAEAMMADAFPGRAFQAVPGGPANEDWSWYLRHGHRELTAAEVAVYERVIDDLFGNRNPTQDPPWWEDAPGGYV